jgi:hypothetical protein
MFKGAAIVKLSFRREARRGGGGALLLRTSLNSEWMATLCWWSSGICMGEGVVAREGSAAGVSSSGKLDGHTDGVHNEVRYTSG